MMTPIPALRSEGKRAMRGPGPAPRGACLQKILFILLAAGLLCAGHPGPLMAADGPIRMAATVSLSVAALFSFAARSWFGITIAASPGLHRSTSFFRPMAPR